MQAVSEAPTAFYFEANADFMQYAGGVFTSGTCGTNVNHAMVRQTAGEATVKLRSGRRGWIIDINRLADCPKI